jgi:hypothetical protein
MATLVAAAAVSEITGNWMRGPYVHGLNKGGLSEIRSTQRLRATRPANTVASDRPAVRARPGTFEHVKKVMHWSGRDRTFIEFMTRVPPRPQLPPMFAEWDDDQLIDGHLPIFILRVVNGEGEPVP